MDEYVNAMYACRYIGSSNLFGVKSSGHRHFLKWLRNHKDLLKYGDVKTVTNDSGRESTLIRFCILDKIKEYIEHGL